MSNRDAVKHLLSVLKGHMRQMVVVIFCIVISAVIGLSMPLLSRRIMDDGFVGKDFRLLCILVLTVFALQLLGGLIEMLKEKIRVGVSTEIKMDLERKAVSHLLKMKTSFYQEKNSAEIMNNLSMDVSTISSIAENHTFFVVTQVFNMLGGIIGLCLLDYRLTLLVLLFLPVKAFMMSFFARKRKEQMDSYIQQAQSYSRWFGSTVGGAKEIKLFGIYQSMMDEFRGRKQKVIQLEKDMTMLSQYNSFADGSVIQFMIALIYILGAVLIMREELTIGTVFAFISYSVYVTAPISAILNVGFFLSGIIPSTKRFFGFLAEEEEQEGDLEAEIPQKEGALVFEGVSFSYDTQHDVFRDLNLQIPLGSKVLIAGENGAGKSTIIDLLLRLYEPTGGTIKLAGKEIRSFSLSSYRELISVVSQDVYLFQDTIRRNIDLSGKNDDETIQEVCRQCGLGEFIEKVTLDYTVGQNGMMLSGGQKQKIALARAILQDRPIMIFDEATAHFDQDTKTHVQELLHNVLKDKTVLIVSHQSQIAGRVDMVIRLEQGRAVCENESIGIE